MAHENRGGEPSDATIMRILDVTEELLFTTPVRARRGRVWREHTLRPLRDAPNGGIGLVTTQRYSANGESRSMVLTAPYMSSQAGRHEQRLEVVLRTDGGWHWGLTSSRARGLSELHDSLPVEMITVRRVAALAMSASSKPRICHNANSLNPEWCRVQQLLDDVCVPTNYDIWYGADSLGEDIKLRTFGQRLLGDDLTPVGPRLLAPTGFDLQTSDLTCFYSQGGGSRGAFGYRVENSGSGERAPFTEEVAQHALSIIGEVATRKRDAATAVVG